MSKKPNEWERFAFTSLEVNPQPWHMPLPDLKAAILKELSTTGQIEPWSLYYFLVREAALIPQEIRNYLAEIAVGRKKYKKPSGRKAVDPETKQQISKYVRDLFDFKKSRYIQQGETKTDAQAQAIEDVATENDVSERFIEEIVFPRNRK